MPPPRMNHAFNIAQLERILDASRSKLGKLQKKRERLNRQLATIDAQISGLAGHVGLAGGVRPRNKMSLNDAIAKVLHRAGDSVQVADIVKGVLRMGYKSSSDNFRGIVNQALIKDPRFAKGKARGMYVLKK